MKVIKYFCNLCKEEKLKNEIHCIYFDSSIKVDLKFGGYKIVKSLDASDKHICLSCINMVKNFTI